MSFREKVLVVDDVPENRRIMGELLSRHWQVAYACDGPEALAIAERIRPDLVLLDLMMQGMTGLEVLESFRRDPNLKYTKVIIVSAKAGVSDRVECLHAGADDYLSKPFNHEEFVAKVRVHLRLRAVEEIDSMKDGILSLLGHETRTPLNGILAPLSLVMSTPDMPTGERNELIGTAHHCAMGLHQFIEKAMLFLHLKSKTNVLDPMEIDLRSAFSMALSEFRVDHLDVMIEITEPDESAQVCVDLDSICRVIVSLLDNAVRFSAVDQPVHISFVQDASFARIRIQDDGCGIEGAALGTIFDGFAERDVQHHSEGHGLSLAIAREIVWQHNGSISVESKLGSGSTFEIKLPTADVVEFT